MERRVSWTATSPGTGSHLIPFSSPLLQTRRSIKDDSQELSPIPVTPDFQMHPPIHQLHPLPQVHPIQQLPWASSPVQHENWKHGESGNFRQAKWTEMETLSLVESRRRQVEKMGGWNGPPASADEKWTLVAEEMVNQGVTDKDKIRCRQKWENLKRDYKKVKSFKNPFGKPSFWDMTPRERKDHGLPSYFSDRVFLALEEWLGEQPNLNPDFSLRRHDADGISESDLGPPSSSKRRKKVSYDSEVLAYFQSRKEAFLQEQALMDQRMDRMEELLDQQTDILLQSVKSLGPFEQLLETEVVI